MFCLIFKWDDVIIRRDSPAASAFSAITNIIEFACKGSKEDVDTAPKVLSAMEQFPFPVVLQSSLLTLYIYARIKEN